MASLGAEHDAPPKVSPEALAFVRAIGAGGDLPAFVKHVRTITQVASDMKVRVQMLEDAIVKDVALTAKVLRIANASLWGGGARVGSVKQAILLLGFDRVQHLSSAASVFDHLQKKAPAVEELLALSVLTANQSIHLAAEAGFSKAEVAYLCGLFRHLGEVTVAVHRVSQYGQWLRRSEQTPPPAPGAEQEILGFTFDDVGVALAHQWKLPSEVVNSLRRLDPSLVDASSPLHTITQLSAELTTAVYRDASPQSPRFEQAMKAFAHPLNLSTDTVMEAAQSAFADSRGTIKTMEIGGKSSKMEGRLKVAAARVAPAAPGVVGAPLVAAGGDMGAEDGELADGTWDEVEDDIASSRDGARAGAPKREAATRPRSLLTHGQYDETDEPAWQPNHDRYAAQDSDTQEEADARSVLREVAEQRLAGAGFDLGTVTRSAMSAICMAGYERVLLALSSEDFLTVRGRVGSGTGHEQLIRHFLVRPIASAGPLGAVLHGRTDTFASCEGTAGKAWRRDRTLYELAPRSFGVLPLVLDDKLLGCLYFDTRSKALDMSDSLREMLQEIRDHLVAAFARHRRGAEQEAAA